MTVMHKENAAGLVETKQMQKVNLLPNRGLNAKLTPSLP